MSAYHAPRSFAVPASANRSRHRPSPFAAAHGDPTSELHNARGLVIAILMSAACWAGLGLAFLM